ncbi:neuronal acetylcholine receptor subunit alpha-7-like [Ruditapes philippinarum]|uniref:neuronal acetylcholine receptor subunit alpha-7-like n=1 Tax=Ruditapes philippinarum TaxID=129788 RepID=UPI00295AC2F2|nr:neuronal acetylcholine receptor subunit alpha-7-like [Ruditapes philippinarum]
MVVLFTESIRGQSDTFSQYIKLYKTLENRMYGKIRPVTNQSKPVTVNYSVHLLGIKGLDEKEQLLECSIALTCRWTYENLKWNASEFGDVKTLTFSPKFAWIPDLTISNSVDSMFVLTEDSGNINRIKVMSNGHAEWDTGGNIRTSCQIDITKYPFDSQSCTIIIGKLGYDSEIYLSISSKTVSTTTFEKNGEWKLKSALIEERLVHEDVTQIYVILNLSRYWLFYVVNVLLPVALLSIMMVFSFKIPPVSGERLGYNMALLLSFVVLLNLIGESMPRVSKQVSYLQLYVSYQLSMSVVITMLSIWQVSLHFTKSKTIIPFILKLYFFFCRCRKPKSVASNNEEDDSSVRNTAASDNKEQIQSGMDSAVNQFQEACAILSKAYGETAKECADAYFCYGQALLDLARMENGVLGNALQGI